MLDIHKLKIFIKVADLKSFSNAAHKMYLTQPTVSQHITALEGYLGLKLFDRLGKETALTKAGEILYRYAKQLTALADETHQAMNHFRGKKTGHITLGASTIPGEYILPGLLGRFKNAYPKIKITLKIKNVTFKRSFFIVRDKQRTPSPLCKSLTRFFTDLK